MTNILLVVSDPEFRKALRSQIGACDPECHVMEEAGSIAEAKALLADLSPDVLLLDTCLPDGAGFDLLDATRRTGLQVIFLAENSDFALKAFQYNALDYLLKPFEADELYRVLVKARRSAPDQTLNRQLHLLLRGAQQRPIEKLVLHLSEGIHILPLNETVRLESDGCYTTFYTTHGDRIVVTRSIGDYEYLTGNGSFFRVHQSHIINLQFVRKVLREDGGFAILDSGVKIPIARRRKDEFIRALEA